MACRDTRSRDHSFRCAGSDAHARIYVRKVIYSQRQADVRRAVVYSSARVARGP